MEFIRRIYLIVTDKTNEKYRRAIMNQFLSFFLFRILLPIVFTASIIFRYNGMSLLYLLFFLVSPLIPYPKPGNLNGHSGRYVKALCVVSILLAIGHLTFQIVLLSMPPYGSFLESCDWLEKILRHVGFVRYNNLSAVNVARFVVPEVLMLIISVVLVTTTRKLQVSTSDVRTDARETAGGGGSGRFGGDLPLSASPRTKRKRRRSIAAALNIFLDMILLAAVSIAVPSITSSFYFLCFLAFATWVACYKKLGKHFMNFRIVILIFCGLHLIVLYAYQLQIVQEIIDYDNLFSRLFGLTRIIKTDCTDPRLLQLYDAEWAVYVNPGLLLVMYWVFAVQTRTHLSSEVVETRSSRPVSVMDKIAPLSPGIAETQPFRDHAPPSSSHHHHHHNHQHHHHRQPSSRRKSTMLKFSAKRQSSENSPLLEAESAVQTYQTVGAHEEGDRMEIDPNGSVIWSSNPSERPAATEGCTDDGFRNLRQWLAPVITIVQLITRQSYIATLIIMMAWSITYHSWLTFILLLWSCILWMMPNSRKSCWKSSPFLVAYAEALLIIQYIYSLKLTDEELPQEVEGVKLSQVGFKKEPYLPCLPLAAKILYTIMFWITLRQYMQEKYVIKNKDISEGVMMQPFNMAYVTVQPTSPSQAPQSPPGGDYERQQSTAPPPQNTFMKKLGELVQSLLTKYWIWVVALMLMLNALGGEKVVVFRIIYMALFLFFILIFQLSYRAWRLVMYGFWLTVIMYSMSLLILIYTYQFENFPKYWEKYLHISEALQKDIGLDVYSTSDLFVNLLRATFFVIITIIQLHYFHKDFLRISDIDKSDLEHVSCEKGGSEAVKTEEPGQQLAVECSDEKQPERVETMKDALLAAGKLIFEKVMYVYDIVSDFLWRYLEIHIIKIVLFSVLLLALYDVCSVHFIFVIFVVIALPVTRVRTCISHCCALWASVLLISKMIYQIDYIHDFWQVNCTEMGNKTIHGADWIGFSKVGENLTNYIKGYLGLIFVLTIQAVVKVRMRHHRIVTNEPTPKEGVVYPSITRAVADDGLLDCFKFLVNYGFYKFGVEICLVTITAGVGVRLDLYAVIYAIVLMIMFLMRRRTLARIWIFYLVFLALIIPIQYLLCIGMPQALCIEYLYDGIMDPELREWLFLPDFGKPPEAYKLTVDFFLLLFACCQYRVFRIEAKHEEKDDYEGGSNREIQYDPDYPKNNPVEDYVTYTKSYLDLVKMGIFFSLFWVTLAIFFLAGTNRVSLFAMGYVIGCFLFLWSGQEYFLKPINYILRWWNVLISYTVGVIFIKSLLQLIGCVFLDDLQNHFCWLIQLLSIACLKKFEKNAVQPLLETGAPCTVPVDEAGLLWDGICLAFLLLQKRFFCSYYFPHLVTEMKAQAALANRGAELINQMLMKEVIEQQAAEKDIVEKIKKKMDKIRMHQQKIRGSEYVEPDNHYVGYPGGGWDPGIDPFEKAIRSGDYYLFEDFSDDEGLVELEYQSKSQKLEGEEEEEDVKGLPVSKLLASAMKTDMKHAVSAAKMAKNGEADGLSSEPTTSGRTDRSARAPVSRTVSGASQVSFAVTRRESLSPRDALVRRPQSLPPLQQVDDGRGGLAPEDKGPQKLASSVTGLSGGPGGLPGDPGGPPGPGEPPGSSTTMPDEELDDVEPPEDTLAQKTQNFLRFLWVVLEGLMVSATSKLNIISRDYRYVARCLSKEKKILKEKWLLQAQSSTLVLDESEKDLKRRSQTDEALEIRVEKASEDESGDENVIITYTSPEEMEKEFEADQLPIVRLLVAMWYAAVSRSEIVCYVMIVVNQMKSASILSLPLPFMAFLWGSLSIPRPSKSFWITVITYTEGARQLLHNTNSKMNVPEVNLLLNAIVVIKYLFQFGFFPWNSEKRPPNQPFWAPRILGIEKKDQYAVYDLALLLVVFFHRFILKSLGQWKDTSRTDIDSSVALSSEVKDVESGLSQSSRRSSEGKLSYTVSQKEEPAIDHASGGSVVVGFLQYIQPIRSFMHNLLHPPYRVTRDVYAFMFVCDFTTFLIVVFGYWAFGTGGGDGVASYFEENKVPIPFLVMLIAQFGLIVVDRALFLRKYILGKLVFQIILVFVVHLWMFFILPVVTDRQFNSNLPPQMWYFVKCMYLLLSAYQIRSGYPTRILGNFLTKKYNYLNLILFKGFMFVPFLFELRALMDWIWTDTSMAISSWLKMEDIFANIFVLKCSRRAEAEYPVERGQRRRPIIKYGIGGTLLFTLILLIWFPLVLFALGNTVGLPNPPTGCTIELSISGFEPFFKMSAQHGDLKPYSDFQYDTLMYLHRQDPSAQTFLSNFDSRDVYSVTLSGSSTSYWVISPPSLRTLVELLNGDGEMKMKFAWEFSHLADSKDVDPVVGDEYVKNLDKNDPARKKLASMIEAMGSGQPATISHLLPKFMRVPSKGKAVVIKSLLPAPKLYNNLTFSLDKGTYPNTKDSKFWWVVEEDCGSDGDKRPFLDRDCSKEPQGPITLVSFNDKVFPPTLSIFSGYGIIGLYTTLVLVASRFVRGMFAGVSYTIMFDDMPYVDRVLQLCLDIYLVRESGELKLEEDLFAKLIFLYRSPETLIKWTRFPQEPRQPPNA